MGERKIGRGEVKETVRERVGERERGGKGEGAVKDVGET